MTMAGIINSQIACMAITTTTPMRARLTDITVHNGSTTASFSVSVHGMAGDGEADGIETAGVKMVAGAAETAGAAEMAGAAETAGVVATDAAATDAADMADVVATDAAVAGFMQAVARVAAASTVVVSTVVASMAVARVAAAVSMVAADSTVVVASMVVVSTVVASMAVEGTDSSCGTRTFHPFPDSAAVSSMLAAALSGGRAFCSLRIRWR